MKKARRYAALALSAMLAVSGMGNLQKAEAAGVKVVSTSTGDVKVTFQASANAASYEIYRRIGNGAAKKIGTVTKLSYVDTHAQAERLVGNEVMIEKRLLDEEGSGCDDYDIFQLNGFEAEEEATRECGKVVDVADYSGNIVLTIEIFGKEILLPFSEVYILEADLEKKKLLVSIPQDIIDLY